MRRRADSEVGLASGNGNCLSRCTSNLPRQCISARGDVRYLLQLACASMKLIMSTGSPSDPSWEEISRDLLAWCALCTSRFKGSLRSFTFIGAAPPETKAAKTATSSTRAATLPDMPTRFKFDTPCFTRAEMVRRALVMVFLGYRGGVMSK